MQWVISIPCTGKYYVKRFLSGPYKTILAALQQIDTPWKMLVHTNNPEYFSDAKRELGARLELHRYPEGPLYDAFGKAHLEAIRMTPEGDITCLLCADISLSVECFRAAETRFNEGYRAVFCSGTRTTRFPAPGMQARALHAFSVDNMHSICSDTIWGQYKSTVPAQVYFREGENVTLRAFPLHPFAIVRDRDLAFFGPTVDDSLAEWYWEEEIHIVTNPDEMALIETSPLKKRFRKIRRHLTIPEAASWGKSCGRRRHRWFFEHPIVIQGNRPELGEDVAQQIMASLHQVP